MATAFLRTLYILGISLVTVMVLALLFNKLFVAPSSLLNLALALIIAFLGLIFMSLINFLTSIMAFKVTEIAGIHLVKYNIVEFLSGTLIPLMLLPSGVLQVMKFFPFYYVQYLPASLYLGKSTDEAWVGIVVLIVWNLILWGVAEYTYRRLRRKYEGVGA
jgi:ABC-2 type transport system permease protein